MQEYKCGIYQIYCRINRQKYIGSSVQIAVRWGQHRNRLRKGIHHSLYLQRAWDKYGEDVFTFSILEECSREVIFEREQFYLDTLKPKFNISLAAYGRESGWHHTPEARAKIAAAGTGRQHTSEAKAKIGAASRVRSRTPEALEHLRLARSGPKTEAWKAARSENNRRRGIRPPQHTSEQLRAWALNRRRRQNATNVTNAKHAARIIDYEQRN